MARGMRVAEALNQLGLSKEATEKDVKQAYKDLARVWHPDRFQGDERMAAKTEDKFKQINEAKTVALAYVQKHGHFRFVKTAGEEPEPRGGTPYEREPTRGTPYEPEPKKKAKPEPEPEPEPKKKAKPEPEPKAEPKQKAQPEPEPEPEDDGDYDEELYEEDASYSDHLPGQNILIAGILIIITVGFLFVMGSSFSDSSKDKVEAYLKQREVQITTESESLNKIREENAALERAAIEAENAGEAEPAFSDSFFTLGSSKDWVMLVQGPPFQIKGGVWQYGYSFIQFKGDSVVGWTSSDMYPLSIGMLKDTGFVETFYSFDIGSSVASVVALQGAPDIIDGSIWMYGEAMVQFDSDTVVFFENDTQNLLRTADLQ